MKIAGQQHSETVRTGPTPLAGTSSVIEETSSARAWSDYGERLFWWFRVTSCRSVHWVAWLSSHFPLARFIKFCVGGSSGLFVDLVILLLLADPRSLGVNLFLSKICAAEIALINNFIWNGLWTFRSLGASARKKTLRRFSSATEEIQEAALTSDAGGAIFDIPLLGRFLLFNAICEIGIGLAALLLHVFHNWLGWNLYVSNLLAIVLVTVWNFGLNTHWNWGEKRIKLRSTISTGAYSTVPSVVQERFL